MLLFVVMEEGSLRKSSKNVKAQKIKKEELCESTSECSDSKEIVEQSETPCEPGEPKNTLARWTRLLQEDDSCGLLVIALSKIVRANDAYKAGVTKSKKPYVYKTDEMKNYQKNLIVDANLQIYDWLKRKIKERPDDIPKDVLEKFKSIDSNREDQICTQMPVLFPYALFPFLRVVIRVVRIYREGVDKGIEDFEDAIRSGKFVSFSDMPGCIKGQRQGDLDNIIKHTIDAYNKILYTDDAQIKSVLVAEKFTILKKGEVFRVGTWHPKVEVNDAKYILSFKVEPMMPEMLLTDPGILDPYRDTPFMQKDKLNEIFKEEKK